MVAVKPTQGTLVTQTATIVVAIVQICKAKNLYQDILFGTNIINNQYQVIVIFSLNNNQLLFNDYPTPCLNFEYPEKNNGATLPVSQPEQGGAFAPLKLYVTIF